MSPFQLVYGRLPSGPISLLKEVWVGERNIPTTLSRSVEKYLEDLIEKLRKAHEIAAETAEATQNNYASYYNLRSGKSNSSKSGTSWLDLRSRLRFRGPSLCSNRYGCIIYGDVTDHISSDCQELDDVQRLELLNTLGKFSSLFSSLPGLAKVKGHNLKLKPDFTQKKMHPYRIPIALQQEVDRQINELLHLKLIEPSESEWAHQLFVYPKERNLAINRTDKEPSSNIIPWNEVAEQAFTKLKAQLVKAPSLYTPDLSKPYQLYTDASATAIGACLSQNDEKGKENPIAFSYEKFGNTCPGEIDGPLFMEYTSSVASKDFWLLYSIELGDHTSLDAENGKRKRTKTRSVSIWKRKTEPIEPVSVIDLREE
ncbi:retrovirus-related Pol polyprotein from transposon opus [Trichonephila clavipes]|nr:retrovirus-related Pol polyprotein from transposon opus [Trichonephila clavipes]